MRDSRGTGPSRSRSFARSADWDPSFADACYATGGGWREAERVALRDWLDRSFSSLVCRCLVRLGDSVHRLASAVEKPQNIPPRYPGDTSTQISCPLRVDPSSVFSPRSVLFFASRASTPLFSRLSRAPRASFPRPRSPPPPSRISLTRLGPSWEPSTASQTPSPPSLIFSRIYLLLRC